MAHVNSEKSLTVSALCRKMRVSGRPIKYRTIREWWAQGLLPVPARRWTQRASESYWLDERVFARATAVYDLLRPQGAKYDVVLLQLWLSGKAVPPHCVRRAALRFLRSLKFYPNDLDSDAAIERLGDRTRCFANDLLKRFFADTAGVIEDRLELGDAIDLGARILFQPDGAADEDASDPAALLFRRLPDLRDAETREDWVKQVGELRKLVIEDAGLNLTLDFIRTWINFVAQAEALENAPDLVFVRAQRTLLVAIGLARKVCRRQRIKLGNMPSLMKAIAIDFAPYIIGAYIRLIDNDEYPAYRKELVEMCASVWMMPSPRRANPRRKVRRPPDR